MKNIWIGIVVSSIGIFIFFLVKTVTLESFQWLQIIPSKDTHLMVSTLSNIILTQWTPPAFTYDTIFSNSYEWIENVPDDKKWTLIATGDIIPARSVNYQTVKRNDFTWAWKHIIPILTSGDITLINLESPLVSQCPITVEGMVFCGSQRHVEGLKAAHVTIANVANNHMGNYGQKGIEETKQLLEINNIQVTGLGEPTITEIKGMKVAFLGFDDIGPNVTPLAKADDEEIKKQIIEAKKQADLIVVSMHWGTEYTDKPNARQVALGYLAVDSGADLVIGNHPHWIQPVELYKGKVIMYAHGNTIFDQMWSEKTKEGVIGKYIFYGNSLIAVEYIPTYIEQYGQPMTLEDKARDRILDALRYMSKDSIGIQ